MKRDEIIETLVEQCRRDQRAWINGDPRGYAFAADDDTIMGPFGGVITGTETITPGQQRVAARFEAGAGEIEFVRGEASGDLAYLVLIERAQVRFAGHTDLHRWELRVTEIFRCTDGAWRRTHRQADPLVDRRAFDDVLALLQ